MNLAPCYTQGPPFTNTLLLKGGVHILYLDFIIAHKMINTTVHIPQFILENTEI